MDRNSEGGFRQVHKIASSLFAIRIYFFIEENKTKFYSSYCLCRTDNAVKNRFSTLCKKRAKYEALAKENACSYITSNNKRVLSQNGFNKDGVSETAEPIKKMRYSKRLKCL